MSKNHFDVIIVGGGLSGLTAGAYLARYGKSVLLLEQNTKCGGLASSIQHDGFVLDAGVKGLINAGIIRPMLHDLEINLELVKSKVSIGIEDRIMNVETPEDLNGYRDLLLHFFPDRRAETERIISEMKTMMRFTKTLYAVDNPKFKKLNKDYRYLLKELLPWLPSFLVTLMKTNRLMMPVEEYVDKIVKHQALKDMVLQHFFENMPAFFALGYFYVYFDYLYPKGGIGKLAESLEQKLLTGGGKLLMNKRVIKIDPAQSKVTDHEGVEYSWNKLIWAADLKAFYQMVDVSGLSPRQKRTFDHHKKNIIGARGGNSVFELFLEVDEPPETFAEISNPHFFYTPYSEGLGTLHREDVNRMVGHWPQVSKKQLFEWGRKFVARNTFEISIPALRDDRLAPPGKTGIIINFFMEYRLFKLIEDQGWLEEFKKFIEDQIIEILSRSVYPGLSDKIIHQFSFTPLSINKYVLSSEGAITGWAFGKKVPCVNQIIKINRAVTTPFRNIFQAGQWSYSPSGVPMSIITGKIAADKAAKN